MDGLIMGLASEEHAITDGSGQVARCADVDRHPRSSSISS